MVAVRQLFQYTAQFPTVPLRSLHRLGKSASCRLLSLDLFDTLLLRGVAPEAARFQAIAERLAELPPCRHRNISPSAILEARLQCAHIAYQSARAIGAVREARIDDILSLQLSCLGLPASLKDEFLDVELALETQSLRPNQPLIDVVRKLKRNGLRTIVVSDMYLDSGSLRKLLVQHGLDDFCETIYVSSEFGVNKASERLFHVVAKRESIPLATMLHVGDNYRSDFQVPRRLGVQAVWLPRAKAWRVATRLWSGALRMRHTHLQGI